VITLDTQLGRFLSEMLKEQLSKRWEKWIEDRIVKQKELKDLENAQPVLITKNENMCLEDNTKGMEESTIC